MAVGSWADVMARLNVVNQTYVELAAPTRLPASTLPRPPAASPPRGDESSPWDEWIAEVEFRADHSDLEVPAMPLLEKKVETITHRFKTAASWSPFPVAVTKMMSKKEMREIPEALDVMRKEFARLSGKCWIEKDRRSKKR